MGMVKIIQLVKEQKPTVGGRETRKKRKVENYEKE